MPDHPDPLFVPSDYFRVTPVSVIFPGAERPLELDLGCGDGSFLIEMARLHPERNFLGVERLIGRVEKTAKRIRNQGLTNARVLRLDTTYTIAWLLAPGSASRVHLLCPDPWPKKKHHGKRIFNDREFLDGVRRVLQPGGEFLLKTDDAPYFANAVEVMRGRAGFIPLDWPQDAFPYARTDFELQWLALGKSLNSARWQRLP